MNTKLLTLGIAAAATASLAPAQRILDTIIKTDRSRVRGVEITAAKVDGITYKSGSDETSLSLSSVMEIQWDSPPEAFMKGQGFLRTNDFDNAIQQFGEVVNNAGIRELVRTEADFLRGKAAVGAAGKTASKAGDAVNTLRAFLNSHGDSYRAPEANLLLGRAQRLDGETAAAVATLEEVESSAVSAGWGPLWGARAKYEKALTYLAANDGTKARQALKSTVAAAKGAMGLGGSAREELEAMTLQAQVAEGETYLSEKAYAQAITFYRSLSRAPVRGKDTSMMAAAKAGEGQALFLDGQAKKDLNQIRKAQIALAEASIKDSSGGETSAKATYFLAECLLALGADRESEDFKARAIGLLDVVIKNYPGSRWAAEAAAAKDR